LFTDGSALGNPGPCGAGIVIYWLGVNSPPTTLSKAVSSRSSSYHGELAAIDLALETVTNRRPCLRNKKIHILTDCQGALQTVTATHPVKNYAQLAYNITKNAETLKELNNTVSITWIAGHVNLQGNDEADRQAKLGAEKAKHGLLAEEESYIPLQAVTKKLQTLSTLEWQRHWDAIDTARWTHSLWPKVVSGKVTCSSNRASDVVFNRLVLGHTRLLDNMHKIMPNTYASPNCPCDTGRQTIMHVIMDCPDLQRHRVRMTELIEVGFEISGTPTSQRDLTLNTLLGQNTQLNKEMKKIINMAVLDFICHTISDSDFKI
jgi:ribonuclease HI